MAGDRPNAAETSRHAMQPTQTIVEAARIFDGDVWHHQAAVVCRGSIVDRIVSLDTAASMVVHQRIKLPPRFILVPGFIDTQVNGGGGVLLNDQPTLDGIRTIAAAHRRFGTTALLPTLITDTPDKMSALLAIADAALAIPGVVGFHLEGPFLNPDRRGVHRADLIRTPTPADLDCLLRFAKVGRSVVTLAPELFPPDALAALVRAGLTVSAGHSDASLAAMAMAVDQGLTGVTHLYNAMSQIGPRDGGIVGAAFDHRLLYAGVIADGRHVSASNLRLALQAKSRDRLMLVTDAMPTAASALTQFNLQGRTITLRDDRLTSEDGTLAGAHLTMNEAVSRFVTATGATLEDGLICAARTPAAFLGLSHSHGRIAPGLRADFAALDPVTFEVGESASPTVLDPENQRSRR
jgi:N-acetylglucosamine-6-phosphate deacetylase